MDNLSAVFHALETRLAKDHASRAKFTAMLHASLAHAGHPAPTKELLAKWVERRWYQPGDPPPPPPPHTGPSSPGPSPTPTALQPGAIRAEAFIWGFHLVIPHDTLVAILTTADIVNTVVDLIGPETGPAAPFIELAAAFVGEFIDQCRNMDAGSGIYLSMTWILPGVFVPTPI